ncbi:MAG TPA: hypothetical protein VGK41_04745 [Solirubrobacterales bacterium]
MGRLIWAVALCFCGLCLAAPGQVLAAPAPGSVDQSFGKRGMVVEGGVLFPGNSPDAEDMAVGPGGEIFVLLSDRECLEGACENKLLVRRYSAEGKLDEGFGVEGSSPAIVIRGNSTGLGFAGGRALASLEVGSDGEPVVAAVDGGDVTLFRLDHSGHLAPGFGGDGVVTTPFSGEESRPELAILRDDKIVLATGSRGPEGRTSVVLARYLPNGVLDPDFGNGVPGSRGDGWISIPGGPPGGLGLSPSGGIVLAGSRCCGRKATKFAFFGRRSPQGRTQPPFSPASPWRRFKVGRNTWVNSVIALPRGRVYVVGEFRRGGFALRLLPSGRLDRSFGKGGIARYSYSRMGTSPAPAVADKKGRLYIPGVRWSNEEYVPNSAVLARFTWRGRPDRSWGNKPRGYLPLPGDISEVVSLGFQESGKLVVFGEDAFECIRICYRPARVLTRLNTR